MCKNMHSPSFLECCAPVLLFLDGAALATGGQYQPYGKAGVNGPVCRELHVL